MSFRQPWDVACPLCKAKRGNLCRNRITKKKLNNGDQDICHEARWSASLGLRNPLGETR